MRNCHLLPSQSVGKQMAVSHHLLPSQSVGRRRLATVLIAAFAGEPLYKHGNHETLKQEADQCFDEGNNIPKRPHFFVTCYENRPSVEGD